MEKDEVYIKRHFFIILSSCLSIFVIILFFLPHFDFKHQIMFSPFFLVLGLFILIYIKKNM